MERTITILRVVIRGPEGPWMVLRVQWFNCPECDRCDCRQPVNFPVCPECRVIKPFRSGTSMCRCRGFDGRESISNWLSSPGITSSPRAIRNATI